MVCAVNSLITYISKPLPGVFLFGSGVKRFDGALPGKEFNTGLYRYGGFLARLTVAAVSAGGSVAVQANNIIKVFWRHLLHEFQHGEDGCAKTYRMSVRNYFLEGRDAKWRRS